MLHNPYMLMGLLWQWHHRDDKGFELMWLCAAIVGPFTAQSAWEASQLQTALGCSWRQQKELQWVTYLGWLRKQRWRRGDAALLQPICAHSRAKAEHGIPVLLICRGDANSGWQHSVSGRTLWEKQPRCTFPEDKMVTQRGRKKKTQLCPNVLNISLPIFWNDNCNLGTIKYGN